MAAIDFPIPTAHGQIFRAGNGIAYQWDASRTLWLAQPSSQPNLPPGDFCAIQTSGFTGLTSSYATIIINQMVSGNAGGWYNTSNGRYTPPAGRYLIKGAMAIQNTTGSSTCQLVLRKNGVNIVVDIDTLAGANQWSNPAVQAIVDANGTDWFDLQGYSAAGPNNTFTHQTFMAIPVGVVVQMPAQQQGDFCASSNTSFGFTTTGTVVAPTTIISGNSGGWYNSSTGRFTPPAGRYVFTAYASVGVTFIQNVLSIRKNGTPLGPGSGQAHSQGSSLTEVSFSLTIDCNGTDYIDAVLSTVSGSNTCYAYGLVAFPISGVQGPPGPMPAGNYWRQLKRVVPVAGQATVDFVGADIPADINDLELRLDIKPATNAVGMYVGLFDAVGTILTAANYSGAVVLSSSSHAYGAQTFTQPLAGGNAFSLNYGGTNNLISSTYGISGRMTINNIRDASRTKAAVWDLTHMNDANNAIYQLRGAGTFGLLTAISGLRINFTAGNFAAGGALTLWGSP